MYNDEKQMAISRLEQKVRDLTSKLSCNSSDIGDWKISKCMEYQLMGMELPYNLEELNAARQAVRDEINAVEAQIEALKAEA